MDSRVERMDFVQVLRLDEDEYDVSNVRRNLGKITEYFSRTKPGTKDLNLFKQFIGMLWKKKDYDEAVSAVKQAREKYPGDVDLELMEGEIYLDAKDYANAAGVFSSLREQWQDMPQAYEGLGDALHKLGNLKEAEALYEEALKLDTWDPAFLMIQFQVVEKLAKIFYEQGDYVKSLEYLNDILLVQPRSSKWQLYFRVLKKMGMDNDLAEAREIYEQIKKGRRYQNRAQRYENQGRWEPALKNYQKAIDMNPNEPHYYFCMGSCLESLPEDEYEFQYEEATGYLKAAWDMFPNNPFYAISYVGNLVNTDQWEQAFEVATNAAEKFPELMLPNLRYLNTVLGNDPEYLDLLKDLAEKDPRGELTELRTEIALILKERRDVRAREWFFKAMELYDKKLKREPYNWRPHFDHGNCLFELDRLEDARESYVNALELYGDFHIDIAEKLSAALLKLGKYEDAKLLMEALVLENPADFEYLGRMGMCFLGLEDYQKALEAFNRSILLNKNVPEYLYGAGICAAHLDRVKDVIAIIKDLLLIDDDFIEVIEQEPAFAEMEGSESFFKLIEKKKALRESGKSGETTVIAPPTLGLRKISLDKPKR